MRVALIAVLLVVTVTPKILLERNSAQADLGRFNADVGAALDRVGFQTSLLPDKTALVARQGQCRMLVQNGDRARELGNVFAVKAADYGPVVLGYRGQWGTAPAAARSVFEQIVQDGLARMSLFFDRPAVVALSQSPGCKDVRGALAHLRMRSKINQRPG